MRGMVLGKQRASVSAVMPLRQVKQPLQRLAVGEPERPIGLVEYFLCRMDAEAPEDGGSQIGGCDGVERGESADAVAGAVDGTALDAAPGEHGGVTIGPVISAAAG